MFVILVISTDLGTVERLLDHCIKNYLITIASHFQTKLKRRRQTQAAGIRVVIKRGVLQARISKISG